MAEFDSAVPPGGSGKIVARVDTSKLEGPRTKSVTVRSNDPETPALTLRLSFDARPPVRVLPARLARLRTLQGRRAHQGLLLRRDDGKPLNVTSVSVTGSSVAAEVLDPTDPLLAEGTTPIAGGLAPEPGDKVLRVSVAAPDRPATLRAVVTLTTDHPRQPEIRVPVHVQVRALIRVTPARVHLEPGADDPQRVFVSLAHGARRRFRVEDVRIEGALQGVSAEIVTPPGPIQRVRITAAAGAGDGELVQGELVAVTGLKRVPELRIPVSVRRRPAVPATSTGQTD